MKQLAKYKINFESKWILFSVALMGLACFSHALYFFVLNEPQSATGVQLAMFLIVPMVLELTWIILLHNVKRNAPGLYGIVASLLCILLMVQVCMTGSSWHIAFAVLGYLLGCGVLLVITGGFFPYKYIGLAYFLMIFLVRFFVQDIPGLLGQGSVNALVSALPGLCILGALVLFFGGITGVRNKQ